MRKIGLHGIGENHSFGLIDAAVLLTLIGFGGWLRVRHLPSRFLSFDEFCQLYVVTLDSPGKVLHAVRSLGPLQVPLDYLIDFAAARATGDPFVLRLVSAVWGVLSIVLVYLLGKSLHSRLFGWFWGLLLATSTLHVAYTQTLRAYSLIVFLVVASLSVFVRAQDARQGRLFAILQFIAQAAFPEAIFFGIAELLFTALTQTRERLRSIALCLIPSWILFIVWLIAGLRGRITGATFLYQVPIVDAASLIHLAREFSQLSVPVTAAFAALALGGTIAGFRSKNRAAWLGPIVMGFVLTAMLITHHALHYMFEARHAISLLSIYLGLVAAGIVGVVRAVDFAGSSGVQSYRSEAFILTFSLLIAAEAVGPLYFQAERDAAWQQYWEQSAAFLKKNLGPRDALVAANPNTASTFLYQLDPKTLREIADIRLSKSFDFVLFSKPLLVNIGPESVADAYTFCEFDPTFATIDRGGYRLLRKKVTAAGGVVWLLYLKSFNYIPEENPFPRLLGTPAERLIEVSGGIFVEKSVSAK